MPAPCGGNTGAIQRKVATPTRTPPVPAPCGGNTGAIQRKAASPGRMPPVPAPCGGNTGAIQPKAASPARTPPVPAPCGGNTGAIQPKVAASARMPGSPPALRQTQALPSCPRVIQRVVINSSGKPATASEVYSFAREHGIEATLEEIQDEMAVEESNPKDLPIGDFLSRAGFAVESKAERKDKDWDPADEAADPLDPDDILSGEVRKALGFNKDAKALMKTDTPKKSGAYVCHICGKAIVKGQKVDMDHLPPWKERLKAFITLKGLTTDDKDELTGPNMKLLYNLRGSVFAHSSCNRGHSGEGNYLKKNGGKWSSAEEWLKAGGGPPF